MISINLKIKLIPILLISLNFFSFSGNANSLNCASSSRDLPPSELGYNQAWEIIQIDFLNRTEKQIGLGATIQITRADYYYSGTIDDKSETFNSIWRPENNSITSKNPHKNINGLMLGVYENINSKYFTKAFLNVDKKGAIILNFLTHEGYTTSNWICEIRTEGSINYDKFVQRGCLDGWCNLK